MSDAPLAGRVAVVTGGSRGIGASIATCLGEAGAAVVVSGRDADRLERTARNLEAMGVPVDRTPYTLSFEDTIAYLSHKVAGYDEHPVFDVYAFFCDLTGASMILFALSGVYLWWKTTRDHLWGILCLIASCTYAAGMMLYFAYAP